MSVERLLHSMQKLKTVLLKNKQDHADNLTTNPELNIEQIRYSQGYINSIDYCVQTMDSVVADYREESEEL